MATYSAVSAGEKDADSPINVALVDKLDQNPHAIAEGASGAPKIQPAAIDSSLTYDVGGLSVGGGDDLTELVNITKMFSGQVASGGTWVSQPASWTVSASTPPAYAVFTVTHNLSTTNYSVIATVDGFNYKAVRTNKSSNTFAITTADSSNNVAVARDFDFILIVN